MLDIEEFKKKLDKKSRLMGIDPGRKRVGIAISDENKIIATPYTTLIKNKYSEFLKEIIKIFNENQIKGIVVGLLIYQKMLLKMSLYGMRDYQVRERSIYPMI